MGNFVNSPQSFYHFLYLSFAVFSVICFVCMPCQSLSFSTLFSNFYFYLSI